MSECEWVFAHIRVFDERVCVCACVCEWACGVGGAAWRGVAQCIMIDRVHV